MVNSKLPKVEYVAYIVSCLSTTPAYFILFIRFPHLMYCSEMQEKTYVTNLSCIILVQKRVIHGAKRWDHANNVFYNDCFLTFSDIVEQKTIYLCLTHITVF